MTERLTWKHTTILYSFAFLVRAIVMMCCIQPNGFYQQADSTDYHNCAISIATGNGMHRIDTHEPIFWRTPGYPPYLALFYKLCGLRTVRFEDNQTAQRYSLWIQIACASIIPLILFYLALILTQTPALAIVTAWIAILHPGLVLASTYLLTEGIALIFFYLFLVCFFYLILARYSGLGIWYIIGTAISLGVYTWMRPMGEFIGIVSAVILCIASRGTWKQSLMRGALFALIFFGSLMPWYVRNYQLTGEWFFCPTIGTYLNCFSVPKLLRRSLDKPIEECHKIAQMSAGRALYYKKMQLRGTGIYASQNICKDVAYPIIAQYPFSFMYDWIMEVLKTTFDLYTYQLVPMINGSYWYDPIEEFLPDKIADCLWAHPMPWYARALCWIEFLFSLVIWIGLIGGVWIFVIQPFFTRSKDSLYALPITKVWIISILMIGIIVGMTGGFGYARLRLPAEPLMLILSLTFWYWIYYRTRKDSK